MDETISDQELRRRLLMFNKVVPPVTDSTRKLLFKKLAEVETNLANQPAIPEVSLMNVSSWSHSASEDEDHNSYLLPGTFVFFLSEETFKYTSKIIIIIIPVVPFSHRLSCSRLSANSNYAKSNLFHLLFLCLLFNHFGFPTNNFEILKYISVVNEPSNYFLIQ